MTLEIVYHDDYLLHEHSPTHPERRERLMYTMDQMQEEGVFDLDMVELVEPEAASEEALARVHTPDYLDRLKEMSMRGGGSLSGDTHVSEHTWHQSRLAAGGVVRGCRDVVEDSCESSFVMARPGGHHAFADRGHGFCFTNNTAVAVREIQESYDEVDRVLVWDWDAHHFDGTQEIFYSDPSVLTMSVHQTGRTLFPGTGYVDEVGEDEGEGFNVNVPVLPKTGDSGYLRVVEEVFEPVAREYDPDLVFVEAGQDCHFTDPITDLGVTADGYRRMMERAVDLAEDVSGGDLVASLCGGYGIEGGLPYTNLAVVASMAGLDTSNIREPAVYQPPQRQPDVDDVVAKVKSTHDEYWNL